MKATTLASVALLVGIVAAACGDSLADEGGTSDQGSQSAEKASDSENGGEGEVSAELLEEYRAALPSASRLKVSVSETNPNALTLAPQAELARLAVGVGQSVNASVGLVVGLLKLVTKLPPTQYMEEEQRLLWGPWDNEDGVGKVAVFIEREDDGDMEFSYAFVRTVGSLDDAVPVIGGMGTPAGEDGEEGVGLMLWDLEADNAFNQEHDPDFDEAEQGARGRFAMLFGRGEEGEGRFLFNVASFRNFEPEDREPEDEAINADYFYGRFHHEGGTRIDFLNFTVDADFCDATPDSCFDGDVEEDSPEELDVLAAFFNKGVGRGEVVVSGGDLADPVNFSECWDDNLQQIGFGVATADFELVEKCPEPFDSPLGTSEIPRLSELDMELTEGLDCLATHGVEGLQSGQCN